MTSRPAAPTPRVLHEEGLYDCSEDLMEDFESPDELWVPKSRRTFATNGVVTFSTASMLTIPGWKGAGQAQNEDKSRELTERIAYQLRNLRGPSRRGSSSRARTGSRRASKVKIHGISALGIKLETQFEALPIGAKQWRAPGLTLGVMDELSYNDYASQAYAAALACVQPYGKLVSFSPATLTVMLISRRRRCSNALAPSRSSPSYGNRNMVPTPHRFHPTWTRLRYQPTRRRLDKWLLPRRSHRHPPSRRRSRHPRSYHRRRRHGHH